MTRGMLPILLLCATATMYLPASAGTVYRWVDAQGHVHYSQTPPKNSKVQAKTVDVSPPPPDQTTLTRTKKMERAVKDRNEAQQEQAEKAQEAEKKKAAQQKACQAARERLQRFTASRIVASRDKQGKVVYSSGDDLVKLREQQQAKVDKLCGG